jgi:hypothetical protein
MPSTRSITALSTLTVALPLDTCTAGDSPKKFGSVRMNATRIASPISA